LADTPHSGDRKKFHSDFSGLLAQSFVGGCKGKAQFLGNGEVETIVEWVAKLDAEAYL
jgi:hypothetical protein